MSLCSGPWMCSQERAETISGWEKRAGCLGCISLHVWRCFGTLGKPEMWNFMHCFSLNGQIYIYRYSYRYRDRDRFMSIDRAVLAAFRSMSSLAELCSHTSVSDYTGKSTLRLKFPSIGTDIKQLQVSCVLTSFF